MRVLTQIVYNFFQQQVMALTDENSKRTAYRQRFFPAHFGLCPTFEKIPPGLWRQSPGARKTGKTAYRLLTRQQPFGDRFYIHRGFGVR